MTAGNAQRLHRSIRTQISQFVPAACGQRQLAAGMLQHIFRRVFYKIVIHAPVTQVQRKFSVVYEIAHAVVFLVGIWVFPPKLQRAARILWQQRGGQRIFKLLVKTVGLRVGTVDNPCMGICKVPGLAASLLIVGMGMDDPDVLQL